MFYLYHHNDLATLASLFEVLRNRQPASPLQTDTVIAPNAGIGRWLRIQLAESEGIAANIRGLLPGEFIWDLFHAVLPDADYGEHFEPRSLPWHLYIALPNIAGEVSAVADYLGQPVNEVRRYQLAHQLADVFDQYLIHRADMLERWEQGHFPHTNPGAWQARVWHWLTRRHRLGHRHRACLIRNFIRHLADDHALQQRVEQYCPSEIYCFGLVALAPDQLRLFYALARHIDVHFLLPNPSAAYWGDITSGSLPLELPTDDTGMPEDSLLPGELGVESEHPLLSSLGRMARDTIRILYSDEFADIRELELGQALGYQRPPRDSLLHRIQRDIVELDCHNSPQGMADEDRSLEIHACHSPLREIQVLQDQILDRLAREDDRVAAGEITTAEDKLAPRDIIVMLPEISKYAPAIQAVFGGAPADRYLPFGLADRARSAAHPIITTFSRLLELPLWRWRASELLDLLAIPAVMRRFDLTNSDLTRLGDWLQSAGVRWGRDAEHRAEMGAGHFEQNTWRFGLDRLLLGVAQNADDTLTAGVAPWSDLEGNATQALGKLWRFEDTLTTIARGLRQPTTPGQWQTRLNNMVDLLLLPDADDRDEQRAIDTLRNVFAQLETAETYTAARPLATSRLISWEAIRDNLRSTLDKAAERQPFLAGGITFCGMVPLRAVPFRMICVLGLNDAVFPRQDEARAFNVMFDAPRMGDRSFRDDDRLLFLQALTAAREHFYISYIGQDICTGEALPPSPIVGELLDFVHRYYFRGWSREAFEKHLLHHQPMQPFSSRYFSVDAEDDPHIFTYADAWRAATHTAIAPRGEQTGLLDGSRADLPEPLEALDLATLKRFFRHPARYFFEQRLNLSLELATDTIEDEEPTDLTALEAARLRRRLFEQADRQGKTSLDDSDRRLEHARGFLPPSPLGADCLEQQAQQVQQLLPIWQAWHAQSPPQTLDITLADIAGVRLTGRVSQCWPGVMRCLRTGKLKTWFRLDCWIDYLAAVAAGHELSLIMAGFKPQKQEEPEYCEFRGQVTREEARDYLGQLMELYKAGQQYPLAFHPDMADEYNPDQDKALANVARRFQSDFRNPHHLLQQDAYFPLLLGPEEAPLGTSEADSPFIQHIQAICGPMNAHIQPVDAAGQS